MLYLLTTFDILQPHAFVSCTDASRSWHGTSVQCVQPLPMTAVLEEEELIPSGSTRKHPSSSPIASPVPVERRKRRRRTLTELSSPHTSLIIPQTNIHTTMVCDSDVYGIQDGSTPKLEDFRMNHRERTSIVLFQEDIFKCMLLRLPPQCKQQLPGLQSLINCVRRQTDDCEVSRVAYVEINSESADSKHTLLNVLGKVHQTFVVQQR